METLKPFLDRYDTVLLDMDGVVTDEAVYWNAAALTVWELLFSRRYFGSEALNPGALSAKAEELRKEVFCNDAVIRTVKKRGFNNNWDLAWLVICGALILKTHDFNAIHRWLSDLPSTISESCTVITTALMNQMGMTEEEATCGQGFWITVQYCFQEWFLGSELFPKYWSRPFQTQEKPGLTYGEEPIVDKKRLLHLCVLLTEKRRLGIGTGRPYIEAATPLSRWNMLPYISQESFITYQDVCHAQEELQKTRPDILLTKPHPYVFLRGVFGRAVSDTDLLSGRYDRVRCKKTLVIGDALCDLFAARAAGCDFAAVLTGIEGEAARPLFEQEKADYILHNILELLES